MTPTPTTQQPQITMSANSVARLLEVLYYCDEFLRTTHPPCGPNLSTSAMPGPASPPNG